MVARVYLEQGRSIAFAVALEWPGWCRRARTAEGALEALDAYRPRYGAALSIAFRPGELEVVDTVAGTTTTDFGAPSAVLDQDYSPLSRAESSRRIARLDDCWNYLDRVLARAPAHLIKGPRGGGRDRDQIADHVRDAERAYAARVGAPVAPRTPWPAQRATIREGLAHPPDGARWPAAYAVRRIAWHVLDHAWEIEDRSS